MLAEYLMRPATLRSWAHLSIQQRCHAIEAKFGIRISRFPLYTFYHKHGIRRSAPWRKISNKRTKNEHDELQLKFLLGYVDFLKKGFSFYWIDETSVNMWSTRGQVWQYNDDPMKVELPLRGRNVTVLGSLGPGGSIRY